jgi:2-aminomuconate deaminase
MSKTNQPLNAERAPAAVGSYPHVRKAGGFLFLSGVGPRKKDSKEIPGVQLDEDGKVRSYDIEPQCHSVFKNVQYILEDNGARWEDLVDVTVFLTDMERDFQTFNKIYAQYFSDHQPARTTVEVNALPTPIAVELKCIALA